MGIDGIDDMVNVILAAGALGTAAFGIVEGLKYWRRFGLFGFDEIKKSLGPLWDTLSVAFGSEFETMLEGVYFGNRADLDRTLRQGIRIGLTANNAVDAASILKTISGADLKKAAAIIEAGKALPDNLKNVVGRYELAADARVDSALRLAETRYVASQKLAATAVALVAAVLAGIVMYWSSYGPGIFFQSLIVGVAAVPLAPIAKDVATALQSAAHALRRRA
jgi:hypothetical protein